MAKFSDRSRRRLSTCHPDLQAVMNVAILGTDFTVLQGHRTVEEQKELYAQGRTKPGNIVTHIDGVTKKGNHNYDPSKAVDIAPYPVDWSDIERFHYLAGYVMACAARVGVEIAWGGHWKRFKDLPHFELVT